MFSNNSRRQFLKNSSLLTASATLAGGLTLPKLTVAQSAHAAGSDMIKLALIGCGGRGNGAIRDRVQVGDNCKVFAVADAFEGGARLAARRIREDAEDADNILRGKVDLPDDRVFWGLDSYKHAIASLDPGDQVLIATPPGYRPWQYRAAVERGCHVWMEKPLFVDAPGFTHTMETNRMADERGLKVSVGFHLRSEPRLHNWMERIQSGAIGDIQYTRVFYNCQGIWIRHRVPGEGETHFQARNWYHFPWISGNHYVEQHVHNLDIGNWVHGKGDRMAHPVSANGMGGRTFKAGPEELMRQAPPFANRAAWDEWYWENRLAFFRHGQSWDNFFVEFTYADGSRMYSQARHTRDTWQYIGNLAYGTGGSGSVYGFNSSVAHLFGRDGREIWSNTEAIPFGKSSHQWQNDIHVRSIREDLPQNDGYHSAMSSMVAVLGREAAYSGRQISWDDLVARGRSYFPDGEILSFDQTPPVLPDADGFYESSVPRPGEYDPFV